MKTGIPRYNVTELTILIKNSLEEMFPVVRVTGEISGFRPAASGHCYFNLKDGQTVINAVLFRQQRRALTFTPEDGMLVSVLARVTVYPQRGNYQLICESMEKSGKGDILKALEQLKERLKAEGLFDGERKRPLPHYPRRIGVVTSARGAALQDIIKVLGRRMPSFRLSVADALVQGDKSAASIVSALDRLYRKDDLDLIILSRGGGSLEDLLSFSDESVVRKVSSSPVPLVCAVGHETDFSLAEFAADVRAATPSAAAELVSRYTVDLETRLIDWKRRMADLMAHNLDRQRWRLDRCGKDALTEALSRNVTEMQQALDLWNLEIPRLLLDRSKDWRRKLDLSREVIQSASPETALSRGYALIYKDGEMVHSASSLVSDDRIRLRFSDGDRHAAVIGED